MLPECELLSDVASANNIDLSVLEGKMAERSRFGSLSSNEIEEELWANMNSKNTQKQTRHSVALLKEFLLQQPEFSETAQQFDREGDGKQWDDQELNIILKLFYANIRRQDGTYYKKNTLISHRHALARYFKVTHKIDILDDPNFQEANLTYKSVMVELKKHGYGRVDHHLAITEEDMKMIYGNFDTSYPRGLQEKVLFEIMYYLCRRGQENIDTMTKDTFDVRTDQQGRRYVVQVVDELLKNQRENDDEISEARMYEIAGKHGLISVSPSVRQ